jgi:SP family general alpha glucoside:H+ symporter-like MFS transporter
MGRLSSSDPPAEALQATEIERLADAQDANTLEHDLTFFEALKLYPKGVFWSIVMSTAVIMEGYDTKLIGTLFAQPAFQKSYGQRVKAGSYQISAPWQTGLSNGSAVGQLLGLLIAGYISERFGFRKTIIAGLAIVICFIVITFFAPTLAVLEVGQILFGNFGCPSCPLLNSNAFCRSPVGIIPDNTCYLCARDLTVVPSCVSNELCQFLLGMATAS